MEDFLADALDLFFAVVLEEDNVLVDSFELVFDLLTVAFVVCGRM